MYQRHDYSTNAWTRVERLVLTRRITERIRSFRANRRIRREIRMSAYELAQLNIATMKEPLDSPVMADFVANLDRINSLAETSPGFVWRLKGDGNDATSLRPLAPEVIVNMSVWKDVASLNHYVFKTAHLEIMRRRKEWFERMRDAYAVLWWVRAGHRPTVAEAIAKLELLRLNGPTKDAFTFKRAFPSPDVFESQSPITLGDECPTFGG